jgi:glycosyltransferase involved in cell wall biosynthesis
MDPSPMMPGVAFRFVPLFRRQTRVRKFLRMLAFLPGWVWPSADFWPWSITEEYRAARAALFAEPYDLMLCNDLNTMLLGAEARRKKGIPFVADYHEFPAGEASELLSFRLFKGPHGHRCLKRFAPLAAGSVTVNQPFADSFRETYGFPAIVVLNAPELRALPPAEPHDDGKIHLIHHGVAAANRNLELMIRALPLMRPEFVLHLMMIISPEYLAALKQEAETHAPGRVFFEDLAAPTEVAARISKWDIGLSIVHNHSFNNEHALPNKLFEYLHGGLAVCCSRSPALDGFIREHDNGWLTEDVSSESLARCLNAITREDLEHKKQASLRAREKFHAGAETAKLVELLTNIAAREKVSV